MYRPAIFIVCILSSLFSSVFAAPHLKPQLMSGPMQGHTTASETMLWILVRYTDKAVIKLKNTKTGKVDTLERHTAGIQDYKHQVPLTFDFKGLDAGTEYEAEIILDGRTVLTGRKIHTFSDHIGDFSFIEGSCAYLPPVGFRWIQPGINERVYNSMIKTPSDFMMWTGDYLYFWKWHYKSCNGMMEKSDGLYLASTQKWSGFVGKLIPSMPFGTTTITALTTGKGLGKERMRAGSVQEILALHALITAN